MFAIGVAVTFVASAHATAQTSTSASQTGCAQYRGDAARFHPCVVEAAKTFNPPRLPDGHPNFGGFWGRTVNSYDVEDHPATFMIRAQKSMIVDPPDGKIPYQPWAAAQKKKNAELYLDPDAQCLLPGLPRATGYMSDRLLIRQPKGYVIFISGDHGNRIIPLNGRPHVGERIRLWNGDSRGRWEGDTLVVDVTNQTGKTWIDIAGNFASDTLHIVERYTLADVDTLEYRATLEDPKVFTRPWTIVTALLRNKGANDEGNELWLESCHEGERDAQHLLATHDHYPGWTIIAPAAGR